MRESIAICFAIGSVERTPAIVRAATASDLHFFPFCPSAVMENRNHDWIHLQWRN